MSSLARRSLRTTAAAAGIAALGAGLAGPASALPEAPALPGIDALEAPAAPDLSALEGLMGGGLPAAPSEFSDLPQLFTFEAPTLNAVGPEVPEVSGLGAPELPGGLAEVPATPAPSTEALDGIATIDLENVEGLDTDPQSFMGQNRVGSLPDMATAAMLVDTAQRAMAGESVTENNTLG